MLTFKYIPYAQLKLLSTDARIALCLTFIKENHILIIEGRLTPSEESLLITKTMDELHETFESFNGIELGALCDREVHAPISRVRKVRRAIAALIHPPEEKPTGVTIIGPARIIKELRQEPEQLCMQFQEEYLHAQLPKKKTQKRVKKKVMKPNRRR